MAQRPSRSTPVPKEPQGTTTQDRPQSRTASVCNAERTGIPSRHPGQDRRQAYALLEPPEFGMDLKSTTASPTHCGIARPARLRLGSSASINHSGNSHVSCSAGGMPRRVRVVQRPLGPRKRVRHSVCETVWRVQLVHCTRFGALWNRRQYESHTQPHTQLNTAAAPVCRSVVQHDLVAIPGHWPIEVRSPTHETFQLCASDVTRFAAASPCSCFTKTTGRASRWIRRIGINGSEKEPERAAKGWPPVVCLRHRSCSSGRGPGLPQLW